ncbi:MAG: carboxy-S-adenosyl-L-methionine synthase CmoA [Rhodothermales bacterium]
MTSPASEPDRIYAAPLGQVPDFVFDASVAAVFPDMIARSVPGYAGILSMLSLLARRHALPASVCYDLGCSLGASTLAMRRGIAHAACRIVAVDNAESMAAGCRKAVEAERGVPVEVRCADIEDVAIEQASLVVMNFTLQFIPLDRREPLLRRIRAGMVPGGALVLSEKVAFADARQQEIMTALHHDFKRANGYSDLEISQKRAALERVLIPETIDTHRERLARAGFSASFVWHQALNFVSMLALP